MAFLTIPNRDKKGLAELIALPDEGMRALVDTLRMAPLALQMRDLVPLAQPKIALSEDATLRILRVLASLYAAQSRKRFADEPDKFIEEVCRAAEKSGDPDLQAPAVLGTISSRALRSSYHLSRSTFPQRPWRSCVSTNTFCASPGF